MTKLSDIIDLKETTNPLFEQPNLGQWRVNIRLHASDRESQRAAERMTESMWYDLVTRATRWLDRGIREGKIRNGDTFLFYSKKLEQGIVVAPNIAAHEFRILTVLPQGHTKPKGDTKPVMMEGMQQPTLVYI